MEVPDSAIYCPYCRARVNNGKMPGEKGYSLNEPSEDDGVPLSVGGTIIGALQVVGVILFAIGLFWLILDDFENIGFWNVTLTVVGAIMFIIGRRLDS